MTPTHVAVGGTLVLAMVLPGSVQTSQAPTPAKPISVSTDHLKLRAYPGAPTVMPGGRVSLIVDIEPRKGMHVYAPGDHDYRVISMTVPAQPFLRVLPLRYPKSEIYFFAPLAERIPVYQKRFTLVQDVVLDNTPKASAAFAGRQHLTLAGTLEYQACDDRLCFNPVSVPLSWTVAIGASTRDRPIGRPSPPGR